MYSMLFSESNYYVTPLQILTPLGGVKKSKGFSILNCFYRVVDKLNHSLIKVYLVMTCYCNILVSILATKSNLFKKQQQTPRSLALCLYFRFHGKQMVVSSIIILSTMKILSYCRYSSILMKLHYCTDIFSLLC